MAYFIHHLITPIIQQLFFLYLLSPFFYLQFLRSKSLKRQAEYQF